MGGFTAYTFPSPSASEDGSDVSGNNDADKDDGASLPSDDEMST